MYPSAPSSQRGSALIIAVFVIVVMSSLALVLLNNLSQEDRNLSLDVNHTRAWAAAESGVDWALARVLNRSDSPADACATVAATTLTDSNGLVGAGLVNCRAFNMRCNWQDAAADDSVSTRFVITVEGVCGSGAAQANTKIEILAYE